MILAIDRGNTSSKAALFSHGELKAHTRFDMPERLDEWLAGYDALTHLVWISVRQDDEDLKKWLSTKTVKVHSLATLKLPFTSAYRTPQTLGPDRVAAIAGARQLFGEGHVLAIDAGTCITFDLLDEKNIYQGGSISPGISMRYKALHNFTGKLPLLEPYPLFSKFQGSSTEESIHAGVIAGTRAEVKEMVSMYSESYRNLQVVLTGGDRSCFEAALKNPIFADPFLVLRGLDSILRFNVR